jgi:hypothetical protein
MRMPFRNNPLGVSTFRGRTAFIPEGKYILCSLRKTTRKNPLSLPDVLTDTWASRFIVGLSVRKTPYWRIENLIAFIRKYMVDHKVKEDASFVAQHGVYTHKDGTVVQEESAQIFLINDGTWDGPSFKVFSERLAEYLVKVMLQEMIVVEIQHNGVVTMTWFVVSKDRHKRDIQEAKAARKPAPRALTAAQIRRL